jgi:predicted nucleic acid-binding protein
VLDSSVLVTAERQQLPVSTLLDTLQKRHNVTEIVLSAVSVVELEHGIYRAQSPQQAAKRRSYLDTVFAAIPAERQLRKATKAKQGTNPHALIRSVGSVAAVTCRAAARVKKRAPSAS